MKKQIPLNIPPHLDATIVLATIDKIVKSLSYKFRFGFFTHEDVAQEARIIALERLIQYDESLPLENFLRRVVYNGLVNFKRDNGLRKEKPCKKCPFYDPKCLQSTNECAAFEDRRDCDKYKGWEDRNKTKESIINPLNIVDVDPSSDTTNTIIDDIDRKDLLEKIDAAVPKQYREDFLKMKAGVKLPKHKRDKIIEVMKEVLNVRQEDEAG